MNNNAIGKSVSKYFDLCLLCVRFVFVVCLPAELTLSVAT
jgi:hypothetical protein